VYDFVADNSFRLIWGSKRKITQPLKFNDPEPLSFHGILPNSKGERFSDLITFLPFHFTIKSSEAVLQNVWINGML